MRNAVLRLLACAALGTIAGFGVRYELLKKRADSRDAAAAIRIVDFAQLEQVRVQRNHEWRDARVLRSGKSQCVFATIPEDAILRLVFVPRAISDPSPTVRVFAGPNLIETITAKNVDLFASKRIDLSRFDAAAGARVVFDSPVELLVARCEFAPGVSPASGADASKRARPNVLIFLTDTLRPDHLGCYGYRLGTSPNIDALAADGIRFASMFSQASWTRPAVASLLTSTYEEVHGAKDRADVLRPDIESIEKVLGGNGYETQGFMGNATCLPMWGIGNDFSRFVDVASYEMTPEQDNKVVDAAIGAIREDAGRPWLFYVHTIGPHEPYDRHDTYTAKFETALPGASPEHTRRARTVALYDGEVAFTDAQFGRLVHELRVLNLYDNSIIVLLSDHGEEFWEHGGTGHGTSVYDEQIRVPCIMKLPGSQYAGTLHEGITQLIDIAPTVIAYLGISVPPSFQGQSLIGTWTTAPTADATAFSSIFLNTLSIQSSRNMYSKFVLDNAKHTKAWFDLTSDAAEQHPLDTPPPLGGALEDHANRVIASGQQGFHILVTGSLRERHTITGSVRAASLGEPHLYYAAKNGKTSAIDGGFEFSVVTSPGPNSLHDIEAWHENIAEQNHAHISVSSEPEDPIEITVKLDGNIAPSSMIFAGREFKNMELRRLVLNPKDLYASPELFYASSLPRRLAVYVWFVPPAESISDTNLKPDMADALRALGYLK